MTAVEWLEEQLFELRNPTLNQIEIMKQAKEMEKKQIIHAVEWNYKSNMGEVYYNATYKKKR